MKFISKSPEHSYATFSLQDIVVFIEKNDSDGNTPIAAESFCRKHGYLSSSNKPAAIYYVRGNLKKVEFSKVLVGILDVSLLPKELHEIIHCLTFWNQEGEDCYQMNGKPEETYQDFILKCIACDCQVFTKPYENLFITGRGGNHVWIADKATNERIFMIHF